MPALPPVKAVSVSLSVAVVAGSLVGFAFSEESVSPPPPRIAVAETLRAPLPAGSHDRGAAGVEGTALRLAAALDAVPVREGGDEATRFCPQERLRVRWVAPVEGEFSVGGHVSPVGPAPDETTGEVNGLVVCESEPYAYMGFEARWDGAAWSVAAVPSLSDEHDLGEHGHDEEGEAHEDEAHEDEHAHEDETHADETHEAHRHETPAHVHEPAKRAPKPAAPAPAGARGFSTPSSSGIEGYASYDPQRVCDPAPKPGTTALKNLLMGTYPGTRNLGVSRTCTARGVSEHKEGRAFDWGVNVGVASERAAAERVLAQLLATDAAGNRHALARRLGVMYVIWDKRIWSAYSASRGWRAYGGANPHTDHVHISLSWDGAMGRTSYWQGSNAALLQFDPELQLVGGSGGTTGAGVATGGDRSGRDDEPRASRRRKDEGEQEPPSRTGRRERDALRHELDEARREYGGADGLAVPLDAAALAELRAAHEARKAAQRAAREAAKLAREQAREAERQAHEARKAAERQAHEARKAAERQAREAATAAARQQGQQRAGSARDAAAARTTQAKPAADAKRAAQAERKAAVKRTAEAKRTAQAERKAAAQRKADVKGASKGAAKGAKKGGKGRG